MMGDIIEKYISQEKNEGKCQLENNGEQKVENNYFNILFIKGENNFSTIFQSIVPFLI